MTVLCDINSHVQQRESQKSEKKSKRMRQNSPLVLKPIYVIRAKALFPFRCLRLNDALTIHRFRRFHYPSAGMTNCMPPHRRATRARRSTPVTSDNTTDTWMELPVMTWTRAPGAVAHTSASQE
jgi:hypothetical protein